jgi:hypothetical protein
MLTNVRAHRCARVDSDEDSFVEHEAQGGGTVIHLDVGVQRVLVLVVCVVEHLLGLKIDIEIR